MKRIGLLSLFLSLIFLISCSDKGGGGVNPTTGFLIVNEGWFGHENGSADAVSFTKDTFAIAQRGLGLGVTTCYATHHNGATYFVSKQGERLIQSSDISLTNRKSLTDLGGGDGRAFVGISPTTGAVSTSKGVFLVTLNPELVLGELIEQTKGAQCGAIHYANNKLYVINQNKGLQVFDASNNYDLISEVAKVNVGFTVSKSGEIWCAGKDFLVKIKDNRPTILALPSIVTIYDSWGAWNAGSLCSSPTENALYFAKNSSAWGGGNEIFKYNIEDNSCTIFARSKDATDAFYGASIRVSPYTGNIWATFVGGYDYNDNRLVEFDHKTGVEISRHKYSGYKFPALILF